MGRALHTVVLVTLAACALAGCQPDRSETLAPCPPGDPSCEAAGCSDEESLAVYRRRIEPLLDDARPSSCNGCHLTGIPIASFVRDTPCQSMACLVDKDLVDFDAIDDSLILRWIAQGQPHPEMAGAAQAEYEGFRAWIEYSARCHDAVCGAIDDPCGPPLDGGPPLPDAFAPDAIAPDAIAPDVGVPDVSVPDANVPDAMPPDATPPDAAPPDAIIDAGIVDDGPCGPETRTTIFAERVMAWKGRCNHCHAPDGITAGVGGAPLWLVDEDTRDAARATMASVVERGYVDLAAPDQSLILLKPLHRGHGGVRHGGGNKFLSREDPAYLDFLFWVDRHARCETGAPLDGGPPDAEPADAGPAE